MSAIDIDGYFARQEARYYRDLDAAESMSEWVERRVNELATDSAEISDAIGSFDPKRNDRFITALSAVLRAESLELPARVMELGEVFEEYFKERAEAEYAKPVVCDYEY
jgi:hypothetical protein